VITDVTELRELLSGTPLAAAAPDRSLLARFSRRSVREATLLQEEGANDGSFGVVAGESHD
jgi:hypothetical protein